MKKTSIIAGLLIAALPLSAQAYSESCKVDGSSANDVTENDGACSSLGNMDGTVDLQASAGVYLSIGDGTATGLANQVIVGGAHDDGSAAYAGSTGGGSVQKYGPNTSTSCSGCDPSGGTGAASAAQAAAGKADST